MKLGAAASLKGHLTSTLFFDSVDGIYNVEIGGRRKFHFELLCKLRVYN